MIDGTPGSRVLLMGNEAIARGALEAGVEVAASYPGTPASEVLAALAGVAEHYGFHAEWSVNEKVAVEVAAGAAYAGARAMASMKQMGLNVASDAVMCLAYIGVEGGLVLVVADDPGPHASQTEQDTRYFASFAKLPVLDPASPQEAKDMTRWAFGLSEALKLPVIVRPTTRTSHVYGDVVLGELLPRRRSFRFAKDPKWTILPSLSARKHVWLVEQEERARQMFAQSPFITLEPGKEDWGVVAGGVSYNYVKEALEAYHRHPSILKVGTPYPLPQEPTLTFLKNVRRVLVVEEQEPVVEDQLIRLAWAHRLDVEIRGKRSGDVPRTGEFDVDKVEGFLAAFLGETRPSRPACGGANPPALPSRPPVLCAGCSHRAAFYAFREACRDMDAVYCGDIGCYTLGYAPPLETQDTCLCMGASITIANGLSLVESGRPHVAFIGDSTFFHAGITGLLNLVYNRAKVTVVVLDNETTAMTGHQPHPGVGVAATGGEAGRVDIADVARGCGIEYVRIVNPNNVEETIKVAREAMAFPGPAVVIARAPCVARSPYPRSYEIDRDMCTDCGICMDTLGCPAIVFQDGSPFINETCTGCGVCSQVCPNGAIKEAVA